VYKKGSVVFRKYATEDLEAAGNGSKGKWVEAGRREDVDKESAVPESVSKTHAEKITTARRKPKPSLCMSISSEITSRLRAHG
jgi:hypothetical protein